jgi:hypothetical protein
VHLIAQTPGVAFGTLRICRRRPDDHHAVVAGAGEAHIQLLVVGGGVEVLELAEDDWSWS